MAIRHDDGITHASLLGHFTAPDDYYGFFGWICGYSADGDFLNEAALGFTRAMESQRAGKFSLAVMLDPTNPPLLEMAGVAHLPLKSANDKPFRLLHAKVALLGFSHMEDPALWKIRLLVSTGNWTRQTLEDSLDLAYRVDLDSQDLKKTATPIGAHCADIVKAFDFLKWISGYFSTDLLYATLPDPRYRSETAINAKRLDDLVNGLSPLATEEGNFFDNRHESVYDIINSKVEAKGNHRRNYLAIGSGFYERPGKNGQAQLIPQEIAANLKKNKLLSGKAELDLFLNRDSCQAIASKKDDLEKDGFTLRRPYINPNIFGTNQSHRFLHAKFIFSALTEAKREGKKFSNRCKNIWIYLGSGNMTRAGLMRRASVQGGNLEAGVVVFPPPMYYWPSEKNEPYRPIVNQLLPINWWEKDLINNSDTLLPGEMEQTDMELYTAPPVAFLYWKKTEDGGYLAPPGQRELEFTVLDAANKPCPKKGDSFLWGGQMPAWVNITWEVESKQYQARIPVMDELGRIGVGELRHIILDDAISQINSFPQAMGEDIPDDDFTENHYSPNIAPNISGGDYPVRKMMRFLELLARKQCAITKESWELWCLKLLQLLFQIKEDEAVSYFRDQLKLNPLYPLRLECFLPTFDQTDPELENYIKVLDDAAEAWGTSVFPGIGEHTYE